MTEFLKLMLATIILATFIGYANAHPISNDIEYDSAEFKKHNAEHVKMFDSHPDLKKIDDNILSRTLWCVQSDEPPYDRPFLPEETGVVVWTTYNHKDNRFRVNTINSDGFVTYVDLVRHEEQNIHSRKLTTAVLLHKFWRGYTDYRVGDDSRAFPFDSLFLYIEKQNDGGRATRLTLTKNYYIVSKDRKKVDTDDSRKLEMVLAPCVQYILHEKIWQEVWTKEH